MTNFDKYLKNQLKDKHFKSEFDALETQYKIIKQIIAERSSQNLTQKGLCKGFHMKLE